MKIRILSDLHREFGETKTPHLDCDLILLAGDIDTKTNGIEWILEFTDKIPTCLVCGNHEFYGDKLPRITHKLKEAFAGTHVHVLENDSISINGWEIFGCTLWTDLELVNTWQVGASFAGEYMNDYKRIRNSLKGYRKLLPTDTRQIHLESRVLLKRFLETTNPSRSIVLTHHAPSKLSLPERRREQNLSCAYASNLDDLIKEFEPKLWIHGHIHHSVDYQIGKTRVISNPQGYPDEDIQDKFDPEFILEIS